MDDKEVGRRVAAARKRAGIKTRKELATLAAIPKLGAANIGKIERGERTLERHEALPLARALEVPVAFFYENEPADEVVESLARLESRISGLESKLDNALVERAAHAQNVEKLLAEQSQLLATIRTLLGADGITLQDHLAQEVRDALARTAPPPERQDRPESLGST